MFLKAAINGGRTRAEHPAVPLSPAEIGAASAAAIAAGADIVHAHARRADGSQTIDPADVGAVVAAVKGADASIVVGTTTGLWTCSGHSERQRLVAAWPDDALPDFASVAFSEEGAAEAARLVVDRGMVLESAVWSLADVPALLAADTLEHNVRILIEPEDEDIAVALRHCRAIADLLRAEGVTAPLLYHGYDATVWPLVEAAIADGAQSRIGFEDGLLLPDGTVPSDNVDLVNAALALASSAVGSSR